MLLAVTSQSAQAVNFWWDGTDGTGTDWTLNTNWTLNSANPTPANDPLVGVFPNSTGDVVIFNYTGFNLDNEMINVNGDQQMSKLFINNTASTTLLGGNGDHTITIASGGILIDPTAGALTIGSTTAGQKVNIAMGTAGTISTVPFLNNSPNTMTLLGNISRPGGVNQRLVIGGRGDAYLPGVLSGNMALVKRGGGTLTVTGANTYTGGSFTVFGAYNEVTHVASGTLLVDYSAAGAPTGGTPILPDGGQLAIGPTIFAGSGEPTASSATLLIKGSNSESVVDNFGTLILGNWQNAGYAGAAHLNLEAGAGQTITLNFAGIGAIGGNGSGFNTGGTTFDIKKGAGDVVHFNAVPTLVNGDVIGLGGSGAVTLNGTDFATFDGGNNIVAATYSTDLSTVDLLDVTAGGGTLTSAVNTAPTGIRFNSADSGATLDLDGAVRPVVGGILVTENQPGNVFITNGDLRGTSLADAGRRTMNIIQNNTDGDLTVSARIAQSPNSETATGPGGFIARMPLVKAGNGRLILTAANAYAGATAIQEGQFQISSEAALGLAGSDNLGRNDIGMIYLNGTLEARGTFSLDKTAEIGGPSNGLVFARTITLGETGAATIDVDAGNTLTTTGLIQGQTAGTLTKTGAGTLVLRGANTSFGGVIVNEGTVIAAVASPAAPTGKTGESLGILRSAGAPAQDANTMTLGSALDLQPGMIVAGQGLPVGTTIVSIDTPGQITVSNAFTVTGGGSYSFFRDLPTTVTTPFIAGATTIDVADATGIEVGMAAIGTGLTAGAVVTAVSGTTITLSEATVGASSVLAEYVFGGANQLRISDTTGLTGGTAFLSATGVGGGTIYGIYNNIVTTSSQNTVFASGSTLTFAAYDSLGLMSGSAAEGVEVNGGVLDLGNITHTSNRLYVNGGTVQNGTLTAAGGVVANNAGPALISANLIGPSNSVIKNGAGYLTLSGDNTYAGGNVVNQGTLESRNFKNGLTVAAGAVAKVTANGGDGGASKLTALNLAGGLTPTATLDLNDNDLVVNTASTTDTVIAQIKNARNGGAWNQPGITSSAADANAGNNTTLGVLTGLEYTGVGGTGTFSGQTYVDTDTLVKYTYYGDTDFNGVVGFDDYTRIDQGFNLGRTGWLNGDFDFSGVVGFDDYSLIDLAFNTQSGTLARAISYLSGADTSSSGMDAPSLQMIEEHLNEFGPGYAQAFLAQTPEPAGLGVMGLIASASLIRRRRRH